MPLRSIAPTFPNRPTTHPIQIANYSVLKPLFVGRHFTLSERLLLLFADGSGAPPFLEDVHSTGHPVHVLSRAGNCNLILFRFVCGILLSKVLLYPDSGHSDLPLSRRSGFQSRTVYQRMAVRQIWYVEKLSLRFSAFCQDLTMLMVLTRNAVNVV